MAEQRLIDANILWHNVDKLPCILDDNNGWLVKRSSVIAKIEDAPTVEAKPVVHAHWQKYDDSEFCYCSYCGKPSAEDDNVSWHGYCPICGATMDEELERLNCGAQMDEEEG